MNTVSLGYHVFNMDVNWKALLATCERQNVIGVIDAWQVSGLETRGQAVVTLHIHSHSFIFISNAC